MNDLLENNITVDDFSLICRVCLKAEKNMVDIFGSGMDIQIMEITNLKMTLDDCLPKRLCHQCKSQVDQLFQFHELAKCSDNYLHSLLTKSKSSNNSTVQPEKEEYNEINFKKSFKRKSKKNCDTAKVRTELNPTLENNEMYLIVVPESGENSEIHIKDLNSDDVNSELIYYCKDLVKNGFSGNEFVNEKFSSISTDGLETGQVVSDNEKIYTINLDIFSCGECKKCFEESQELTNHFLLHNLQPSFTVCSYKCSVCDFIEQEKSNFLSHLETHKQEGIAFIKINSYGERVSLNESEKHIFLDFSTDNLKQDCKIYKINMANFKCSLCSNTVNSEELILSHLKMCSANQISEDNFSLKFTCPVCLDWVNDKENYMQHLGSHQEEGVYYINVDSAGIPFEVNSEVFLSYNEAVEILKVSKEKKIFKIVEINSCDKCNYEISSFDLLCDHYKNAHHAEVSSEVSVVCPVCLEEWSGNEINEKRTKFYEHLRIHKDEGVSFIRVNKDNSLANFTQELCDIFTQSKALLSLLSNPSINEQIWFPEILYSLENDLPTEYFCDLCQQGFSKRHEIIKHLKWHKKGKVKTECSNYICEKCGKRYSGKLKYKKHFEKHIKSATASGTRPTCSICKKTFANRTSLAGHMKYHLKEGLGNESEAYLFEIICEKCGKSFSNNASLGKHKKMHLKDKENGVLKCEICDRDFYRQSTFDRHKSAHLNPKYFECEICKLPLPSAASLQKHLETHRSGSKTFDCRTCKISFLTKDSLTAHQAHTGHYLDRKPLECNVCHQKFFIGKKFTEHIKKHPKYKMGECNLCGKRLSTPQSLMLHMARHFESNCILCPHCGKQFFEERNYNRHLLTHEGIKPFSCNMDGCEKSFYTLFELNRHKKYHNNTRDFSCSYCSKSFHEANHLTVHIRTHTGERPYTCPHCNKGFVTRTRCKHHIKLVHQGMGYDLIRTNISKKVTVFEAVEASA